MVWSLAASGFPLGDLGVSGTCAISGQGGLGPGRMALLLWALASGYVLAASADRSGGRACRRGAAAALLRQWLRLCRARLGRAGHQWPSRIAWLVVLGAGGGMWEATMNLQAGRCADGSRRRLDAPPAAAFSAGAAGGVLGGIVAACRSGRTRAYFLGVAVVLGVLILGAAQGLRDLAREGS